MHAQEQFQPQAVDRYHSLSQLITLVRALRWGQFRWWKNVGAPLLVLLFVLRFYSIFAMEMMQRQVLVSGNALILVGVVFIILMYCALWLPVVLWALAASNVLSGYRKLVASSAAIDSQYRSSCFLLMLAQAVPIVVVDLCAYGLARQFEPLSPGFPWGSVVLLRLEYLIYVLYAGAVLSALVVVTQQRMFTLYLIGALVITRLGMRFDYSDSPFDDLLVGQYGQVDPLYTVQGFAGILFIVCLITINLLACCLLLEAASRMKRQKAFRWLLGMGTVLSAAGYLSVRADLLPQAGTALWLAPLLNMCGLLFEVPVGLKIAYPMSRQPVVSVIGHNEIGLTGQLGDLGTVVALQGLYLVLTVVVLTTAINRTAKRSQVQAP